MEFLYFIGFAPVAARASDMGCGASRETAPLQLPPAIDPVVQVDVAVDMVAQLPLGTSADTIRTAAAKPSLGLSHRLASSHSTLSRSSRPNPLACVRFTERSWTEWPDQEPAEDQPTDPAAPPDA